MSDVMRRSGDNAFFMSVSYRGAMAVISNLSDSAVAVETRDARMRLAQHLAELHRIHIVLAEDSVPVRRRPPTGISRFEGGFLPL